MREIKFKFVLKNKELTILSRPFSINEIINFVGEDTIYEDECFYKYDEGILDFEVIDKFQYTGLKDKNGVEIYEGDIFYDDWDNQVGFIVFKDGAFQADSVKDGFTSEMIIDCFCNLSSRVERLSRGANYLEVVGNIYQNKELL